MPTSSEPSQTTVYANGHKMGKTPVDLKLKPKKDYMIEFRKEGYESITGQLTLKQEPVGLCWIF